MENKLRRGLALLMTLIMLISCAPMDALAAIVPVSGGTQTSPGITLLSIVQKPVATTTYVFMNGTEEFARQIVKDGEILNNPGTPKAGSPNKEFTGWLDDNNQAPAFGAVTVTETKTITYHAQFADVYFVFFTNPNGEVMVTKKGMNGETIFTKDITYPVGNEQSIIGWNYTGNEDDPLISEVKLDGKDVTLKAVVKDGHWITYDSQGGTYVAPKFVKSDEKTSEPAEPSRPGYKLAYWSTAKDGAAFAFGNELTTALTLYAVWTPIDTSYTVIHWQENADDDDYSFAESETKYGTTGAQTSAAAKSYTGFTAQTIAQQTIAGDGSTIVNVRYKRNVYEVKFYSYSTSSFLWNPGSPSVEYENLRITAKYGANISDRWPTYNGSNTWSTTDGSGPYQVNINTMPLNGAKFYGPKTGNNYESAYYYVEVLPGESGDITVSGVTYKLHHKDTSPGKGYIVTKEDRYPITGFTLNEKISTQLRAEYNNAKFYYTRNSYDVVYINNGKEVKKNSYLFEQIIPAEADQGLDDSYAPAGKEGYVFAGWYDAPEGGTEYVLAGRKMTSKAITVYAQWVKPTFIGKVYMTIDVEGEPIQFEEPLAYGEPIPSEVLNEFMNSIMDTVGRDKYEWRGWRNMDDTPFSPDTRITKNITLKPYYTPKGTFSVSYILSANEHKPQPTGVNPPADGKAYAADSYADLMAPDKLVSDNDQYFLGWSDGKKLYQPRDKYQIKGDVTFTGVWGARPATVSLTYNANGGTGKDVVENLANNATVTTKPADTFSRVGYTFKGWDTDPKGEGSIKAGDSVQVDNNGANVLYAIWTANTDTKYTVEFYYQNTDGSYPQKANESVVRNDGTTDTTVSVKPEDKNDRENGKYVYDKSAPNVESGTVAGDGSLKLKLYFKLNMFTITYVRGAHGNLAGQIDDSKVVHENVTYGTATPKAPDVTPDEGYYFTGWKPAVAETVTGDATYEAQYEKTGEITITINNKTVTYNGSEQSVDAPTITGAPDGFTLASIDATVTGGKGTDVNNYPADFSKKPAQWTDPTDGKVYDITYVPGTLTITKRGAGENKVTIKANDNLGVVYDGQAHGENGHTDTNLAEGHHVETVTIDGSRINVGTYKKELVPHDAKIVDADGNDVTDNYEITYKEGDLEIVSPDTVVVTIKGNKDTVEYDGKLHEVDGYTVVSISNALYTEKDFGFAEGAAAHAEGVDADTYPMNLTSESFVNKNNNFTSVTFVVEDGALTITKRGAGENKVTIKANDNLGVVYDGQAHGENGHTDTNLAEGHHVETVTIDGSRINVGTYKKELVPHDAKIVDADGNDVTDNYEITYKEGDLEIRKNETEIKVTANSHTWEYDGQPHSDGGYTVNYAGVDYPVEAGGTATLPTGDTVTATVEGTVTNVADSADDNNVVTNVTITNKAGTVVNDQYKTITTVNGGLTITRRPVQVTVNSKSFTYDAAEHTVADEHGKEYTIETAAENSGLLPGHTESLNVVYDDGTTKTGSRKYVGTYTADSERDENGEAVVTITKADSGEDVTANYAITVKPGTLEIAKAEIEIELIGPKSERVYNGQEQVVETTEITTDEAYAHGAEEPKTIKIVAKGLKGEDYISEGTVIHIAKGTYVGEHPGNFVWDGPHGNDEKPTVLNNDGNGNAVDVTENYTFKTTPGSLTIKSNQPGEHPTQPDKEIDGHEPGTKYALGDRIYFKITVRNITLEKLDLVEVHDPTAVIVDGDGYTVVDEHHAKIENMPASVEGKEPTTVVINAYHVVTEDDIKNIVIDSGYKYENVATITVGDKTIDARKGTNDIEDADYTLKIEKHLINRPASGEKFKLGETAKFQITVTNEGNVTQTDIPVAEKLPGAVFTEGDGYTLNADKTVATITKVLNPADKETQHGDSIILYAQYTITENDLGNTGLKNIVAAPNGNPGEEPIPVDEAKSMAGQKIWNDLDNLYDTRTESVTVNLKRKAGQNGAAEQYKTATVDQSTGWRYSFDHLPAHDMQDNEYFYWVEEEPITGYETVYEMSDDSHCDIVNNLQTYTLTIHYWQHKLGDTKMEQAFPDYVATLYYKQPYDVESPEREGIILDDMSQARISGTMPAHDLVIDVYYHRIAYRLTIHYIYQDGTMAHEDYTWTYWFNSTYNVPSPIIPGFTPSIDVIAGRMPSHGLEFTVVYVGDGEIVVPDEDTSLGFKSYLNAGECFE